MAAMATVVAGKADIRELAKIGARLRLQELDEARLRQLDAEAAERRTERQQLLELLKPDAAQVAESHPRRTLSAAARRKISLAQKRRWAQHRNGNGNGNGKG